jgi:cob(I)alamin adenosyltransferase
MRKAYSRAGDQGWTRDFSGKKLRKDDSRIVIGGKIDSLQSAIDLALLGARGRSKAALEEARKKLWQSAGELSCAGRKCVLWPVGEGDLRALEEFTDSLGEPPKRFIRFTTLKAIRYDECRIRCRELETLLVGLLRRKELRPIVYRYVNRLSSLFFMLAYKETK